MRPRPDKSTARASASEGSAYLLTSESYDAVIELGVSSPADDIILPIIDIIIPIIITDSIKLIRPLRSIVELVCAGARILEDCIGTVRIWKGLMGRLGDKLMVFISIAFFYTFAGGYKN
jgi:hypothetical protein